jgi:hypothetical protein
LDFLGYITLACPVRPHRLEPPLRRGAFCFPCLPRFSSARSAASPFLEDIMTQIRRLCKKNVDKPQNARNSERLETRPPAAVESGACAIGVLMPLRPLLTPSARLISQFEFRLSTRSGLQGAFKIGPLNGREARESGPRLKASVAPYGRPSMPSVQLRPPKTYTLVSLLITCQYRLDQLSCWRN